MRTTYIIIKAESITKLETAINSWLDKGWVPQGGPVRTGSGYAQAIMK